MIDAIPASERHYVPPSARDYRQRVGYLCSKYGAEQLAEQLKAYWRAKGFDVSFWIIPAKRCGDDIEAATLARYDVRSDMVDGRPVRRLA